jgi:membrane fusion protein (multidrug efflux system)
MKEVNLDSKKDNKFFKGKAFKAILLFLIVFVVFAVVYSKNNGEEKTEEKEKVYRVETVVIDSSMNNVDEIKTVGSVEAESGVDVVALSSGTVRSVFFEVGDEVFANSLLADIHNNSLLTNYNNSQVNLFNMQNSYNSSLNVTGDSIRQAELGVEKAEESVEAAKIALKTAEDNRKNSLELQEKANNETRDKAIIAYSGYLNTVDTALDQINYIIQAEDGPELAGIRNTLSARDFSVLEKARSYYKSAKKMYQELSLASPNRETIKNYIEQELNLLEETKNTVAYTIKALDNTVSSAEFSDAAISSQRTAFFTLQNNVVSTQSGAEATLAGLNNLKANNKNQTDALNNAVEAAESQLESAIIGLENSKIVLSNTIKGQDQQVLSAQISLDNAQGQLDLLSSQLGDLTVRAPIKGRITSKMIEIGAEVNPGQKIARIEQSDTVKIIVNLPSSDVYRIKNGQKVLLGDDFEGEIILISPAADPITKKVKVEILFDNKNKELIPGTFIDVIIPVEKPKQSRENSFFIPLRAVTITQNESFVFLVREEKASKTIIKTGQVAGALIEVLSGIDNGDILIVEGGKSLEEGNRVEIIK